MRCQNKFSTPHALKYLGHSWDRFCGDAIQSGSECSRRFAGLALGSWNEFDPRFAPVRNQDRFPGVCQVGNGIETLTRFLLRNRLHLIQICAAFGRIAIGAKLCRQHPQARGGKCGSIRVPLDCQVGQTSRSSCDAATEIDMSLAVGEWDEVAQPISQDTIWILWTNALTRHQICVGSLIWRNDARNTDEPRCSCSGARCRPIPGDRRIRSTCLRLSRRSRP